MMPEKAPVFGEEALDTNSGRTVWWDGHGWSYRKPPNGAGSQRAGIPPLVCSPRPAVLPLSFAQSRLWFLHKLNRESKEYHRSYVLQLRGDLNVSALQRAVNAIVERHEVLRTHFDEVDGEPVQIIQAHLQIEVPFHDLSGCDAASRQTQLSFITQQEWEKPFDLGDGPLLRMRVVKLEERLHILLCNSHHIIFDAWSQSIFNRELEIFYSAFCEDADHALPPLAVQYADFVLWQRSWLDGQQRVHIEHWRKQLSGFPENFELPKDRLINPDPACPGRVHSIVLPAEDVHRLKSQTGKDGATLYMALLAAFGVLLQCYSGQGDILVGSPIANRRDPQLEQLIGFFVNTLLMRFSVDRQSTFRHLLAAVKRTALDAYEHQDLPFERLVQELAPGRSLDQNPFYKIAFVLQNAPAKNERLRGLEIHPVANDSVITVRCELELHGVESDLGIEFYWVYDPNLFDSWRIEQLGTHFIRLLKEITEHPNVPLYRLNVLSEQEIQQLAKDWNSGLESLPPMKCIHELFEAQVASSPEAIAVICQERKVTYGELDCQANQWANYLRQAGIRAESRVAICLDRSVEAIVASLAVLKAGSAYVPIDTAYPNDRVKYMVRDSHASAILTHSTLVSRFSDVYIPVITMDSTLAATQGPAETPRMPLDPQNAAYLIYTSGSSGEPKAVVVAHPGVVRLVHQPDYVRLTRSSCLLHFASPSFDATMFEVWGALLNGGCLVLMPPGVNSIAELASTLERCRVDTLWLTAGVFHALVDEELGALAGVRQLLAGGDVLSPAHVGRVKRAHPLCQVINGYGPTENSTFTTCYTVPHEYDTSQAVPIGHPINATGVYVLDQYLELAPVGVTGELYTSGLGLARGYLDHPGLTSQRFVANPYGNPGSRMYRTGDLARWKRDGVLEFIGRADHQVKVRGFRIELGEIETALSRELNVAQAAVAAHRDPSGENKLVAYVVPRRGAMLERSQLRSVLAERLPDYMLPTAFIFLDQLPLTSNGKVDRQALPAPAWKSDRYRAPRTPLEELLCGMFADLLGVSPIGIDDDFFALGGHSLMAMRLLARIRKAVRKDLAIRSIFEARTIAELAAHVSGGKQARPSLVRQQRPDYLPLSWAQQRLWFIDQLEGASAEYNIPEVVRLRGEIDLAALEKAIDALIERYEILRTRFVEHEGVPIQIIEPSLRVGLNTEDLTNLDVTAQRQRVAAAVTHAWEEPFDLSRGPLIRMKLLRLSDREHVLMRTMHHIISDAWSEYLFNRELSLLYEAFREQRLNPLETLEIQYADFTLWERSWMNEIVIGQQLDYWKEQLAGIPERLELATDRPRASHPSFAAKACGLCLDPELATALKQLRQEHQATLFMTLLAAFSALLARYTRQEDIIVGCPIANRQEEPLESLIGFFVNKLVIRSRINSSTTCLGLLSQIRQTTLDAYKNQELPFERIVQELAPNRVINMTPIFQVSFAFQNAPHVPLQIGNLEMEPLAGEVLHVRHDMEVHAREEGKSVFIYWLYKEDLYDQWRIEQMLRHYLRVLQAMVADQDQPILNINLLEPEEQRQLLEVSHGRELQLSLDKYVHLQFEEQAEIDPNSIAVVYQNQRVSYRELNERANRLAHHICGLGIGAEATVGIFAWRSLDTVVGVLAVLKSGGTYVPLDPGLPRERIKLILNDAQPLVVLTQPDLMPELPEGDWHPVILEDDRTNHSRQNPSCSGIRPETAAYIIYTSGSTGQPKGVVVEHRQIVNYLQGVTQCAQFPAGTNFAWLQPLSVDSSVTVFYSSLCKGGCLHVLSEEISTDSIALAQYFQREGIDCLKIAPSHLAALHSTGEPERVMARSRLIVGGEASNQGWLSQIQALAPGCVIFNHYGPTETTVGVLMHRFETVAAESSAGVPMGNPMLNIRAYVLDSNLHLTPKGVPGELYLAGEGVARGYLNKKALTAERFVANPFGPPGSRMYRTGDLARWRREGSLDFLGRADHQVKIRGFRIELGEIEAALRRHPSVQEAVVAVQSEGETKRLVGYVVRQSANQVCEVGGDSDLARSLKEELRRTLPDYMVPSGILVLDAWPRTPHGKLDRKALPRLDVDMEGYQPPTNDTQKHLCNIIAELLSFKQCGIDSNFFDLGLHSLSIVQARYRLQKELGCKVTVMDFFSYPTIRALSRYLDEREHAVNENTDSQARAHKLKNYLGRLNSAVPRT